MNLPANNYDHVLFGLKERIRKAKLQAVITVNNQLLSVYWEVGKTILEQQQLEGWGTKVIDRLAADLKAEFYDSGFSVRNLKYMRAFAEAYPQFAIIQQDVAQIQGTDNQESKIVQAPLAQLANTGSVQFVQALLAQLSWYHHITLLDKVKDPQDRLFYIQETVKNGWSRDVMVHQIEGGLHQRKGKISSNFKDTIAPEQSELIQQLFKDPYKFDFIYLGKQAKERDLENALIDQLAKFLQELGPYFGFLGRQYKMILGDNEYFYDLLFYHTRLKRYIVIELKIDEFKPEYKGKMDLYLNLADDQLKQHDDEKSIGIILCKTKDGLVAEYALRDSTNPIGIAEYKINEILPDNIRGELPSVEELEAQMEKEYEELKSPVEKRLDALKEKLSGLKGSEIKQTATAPVLFEIIDKSLLPMYHALIKRMETFRELFYDCTYRWQGRNGKEINDITELAENWKNEEFLRGSFEFYFSCRLNGLKKAGTDTFNASFQLNFRIDIYWYGFIFINYNNNQPFIKKLYHEQLSKEEIDFITNTASDGILGDIERQLEHINSKTDD
jgi:predicted nuclease of restriction endonuclease-like (RecB) superfamily